MNRWYAYDIKYFKWALKTRDPDILLSLSRVAPVKALREACRTRSIAYRNGSAGGSWESGAVLLQRIQDFARRMRSDQSSLVIFCSRWSGKRPEPSLQRSNRRWYEGNGGARANIKEWRSATWQIEHGR